MPIVFQNLGASTGTTVDNPDLLNTTDLTVYANSAWTPPAGLILCYVYGTHATNNLPSSITGNGITWFEKITNQWGDRGLALYAADGEGATNEATTITFGATQEVCYALFFVATEVDLSAGVDGAFVASNSNEGTGTSGSITLIPVAHPNNRPISCFAHNADEVATGRANWTQLDDLHGAAPANGLVTAARSDIFETTASATWTSSVAWGGIATEIKAAPSLENLANPILGAGAM